MRPRLHAYELHPSHAERTCSAAAESADTHSGFAHGVRRQGYRLCGSTVACRDRHCSSLSVYEPSCIHYRTLEIGGYSSRGSRYFNDAWEDQQYGYSFYDGSRVSSTVLHHHYSGIEFRPVFGNCASRCPTSRASRCFTGARQRRHRSVD